MTAHLLDVGNPSSLHASGRHARRVVEESRETIAQALGLPPRRGGLHLRRHRGRQPRGQGHPLGPARRGPAPHPHPGLRRSSTTPCSTRWTGCATPRASRSSCCRSTTRGGSVVDALREAVERDPESVSLISVMWANNEVGTLQPVEEVVAVAAEHGIPVHTDAIQAVGAVPVDFAGQRRRRAHPDRAQARRAVRRGRADRPPRGRWSRRWCTAAARSATSAAAPSTPRRSPASPPRSSSRSRSRRPTPPGSGRSATTWSAGSSRWCPTRTSTAAPSTRSARTGCPATPTSASPAARATRC